MLPLMTTLIFQAAGGKSLGKLVTYVALPALLGPVLGPLIGGAILSHLSWRFMFWVNVPFCTAGLLLAWRYMARDAPARPDAAQRPRLDVPGLFLLAPGTVGILLGLANAGASAGFGHPDVIIPLVIGVALLASFAVYALQEQPAPGRGPAARQAVRRLVKRAVVLLRILALRRDAPDAAVLPGRARHHCAGGRRHARTAGRRRHLVPYRRREQDRQYGSRRIALVGFAVVAASTVPFAFAGPDTSEWLLALWMVIRGFGLGCVTMPVMVAAYIGLDKEQIPHSSVLTRTTQQIGGSFGTAVLAVILEDAIVSRHGALAGAFRIAFWWSAGFSAVAVLLSLWLPGAQRPQSAEGAPAPQPVLVADRD